MDFSALSACPVFEGLTGAEIEGFFASVRCRVQRYEKGQTVFHLLDAANHVAIILKGSVQAQKIFPGGGAMQVTVCHRGDMLGQAAAFSEQRQYPCELIALEPAELLLLEREALLRLLYADVRLLERFLAELATTSFNLQWRIELLSYSGIRQKIAFYLLSRSMQSGAATVPIPGSITQWALAMNVSRPSLHRELKALETQGLLTVSAPTITIRNAPALRQILG